MIRESTRLKHLQLALLLYALNITFCDFSLFFKIVFVANQYLRDVLYIPKFLKPFIYALETFPPRKIEHKQTCLKITSIVLWDWCIMFLPCCVPHVYFNDSSMINLQVNLDHISSICSQFLAQFEVTLSELVRQASFSYITVPQNTNIYRG